MRATGIKLSTFFSASLACSVVVATLGSRLPQISGVERLSTILPWVQYVCLVAAVMQLWSPKRTFVIAYGIFIALLYMHAYALVFWPSLRWGVPWQDYILANHVTANYCFVAGLLYLKNFSLFFIPWIAFFWRWDALSSVAKKLPLLALVAGMIVNAVVALIQGRVGLTILAQGSGSAVSAGRAAALLEDSGASTVYFAAAVVGIAAFILFSKVRFPIRAVAFTVWVLICFAGIFTGGRVYFLSSFLGISVVGVAYAARLFKQNDWKRLLWQGIAFSFFIVSAVTLYLKYGKSAQSILQAWESNDGHFLSSLATADPTRAMQYLTLYHAFLEHPWTGNGLGSSFATFYEHLKVSMLPDASASGDPPAFFFGMLAAELGLFGLILTVLCATLAVKLWVKFARNNLSDSESCRTSTAYQCLSLGITVSLLLSFFTGVHIIFQSIACFAGLACAGMVVFTNPSKIFQSSLRYLFAGSAIWLLGCIIFFSWTAPRVPEFRWKVRGKPQLPLSVNVPIAAPGSGTWLRSGSEILLQDAPINLFLELPPEHYPIHFVATAIDRHGQSFATKAETVETYDRAHPGHRFSIRFEEYTKAGCPVVPTESEYCSVRFTIKNPWKFAGNPMGVYLEHGDAL